MALDSAQKRMSAMNLACPWRGPMVDAAESGTTQGNRQAAAFMYSGIAAASPSVTVATPGGVFLRSIARRIFSRISTRVFQRAPAGRVFKGHPFMASILQTKLPKDSDESVGYIFDFSQFPEAKAGETLTGTPTVPAVSGLTIGSPAVLSAAADFVPASLGVQVTISGGTASTTYDLECRATFTGGAIRVVKGELVVE